MMKHSQMKVSRIRVDTREMCLPSSIHMEILLIWVWFVCGVLTETSRLHLNNKNLEHMPRASTGHSGLLSAHIETLSADQKKRRFASTQRTLEIICGRSILETMIYIAIWWKVSRFERQLKRKTNVCKGQACSTELRHIPCYFMRIEKVVFSLLCSLNSLSAVYSNTQMNFSSFYSNKRTLDVMSMTLSTEWRCHLLSLTFGDNFTAKPLPTVSQLTSL